MAAEQPQQTYASHVKKLPGPYLFASIVLAANVIATSANLVLHPSLAAGFLVLVALALGIVQWYVRTNSQVVQNRVIRLEERLRLERLLPPELRPRIPELELGQLVALRFASDAELPELVRQVLDEGLTDRDAIKRRVRDWRPDYLRV